MLPSGSTSAPQPCDRVAELVYKDLSQGAPLVFGVRAFKLLPGPRESLKARVPKTAGALKNVVGLCHIQTFPIGAYVRFRVYILCRALAEGLSCRV